MFQDHGYITHINLNLVTFCMLAHIDNSIMGNFCFSVGVLFKTSNGFVLAVVFLGYNGQLIGFSSFCQFKNVYRRHKERFL